MIAMADIEKISQAKSCDASGNIGSAERWKR
jgi:hypothetical protein